MELFGAGAARRMEARAPLARRMRPRSLDEFVGQDHIVGEGTLLRRAIEADRLSSLIFYGPPGTGKTALAHVIAAATRSRFSQLNAVTAGVAELRVLLEEARDEAQMNDRRTILFIDEIHRFNKAQQDALMPDVEDGVVILIGATVHNPYFSINAPLLSRSLVFVFNPLGEAELEKIARRALEDAERGLGKIKVRVEPGALEHLVRIADGDARRLLNALELGVMTTQPAPDGCVKFTVKLAEESIQKKAPVYERDGDAHYDVASAFIKSMRGGDPDAALYWLARMIHAGEDPRFIARRIVIAASEDVGNADPLALVVANSALQAAEVIGMPEAEIPLAQAAIYVATAPKSNSAYMGISRALEDIEKLRTVQVPQHLRDSSYPGAGDLGHGAGYLYPHDYPGHIVKQEYLPMKRRRYYEPSDSGSEKEIAARLKAWREKLDRQDNPGSHAKGAEMLSAKRELRERMIRERARAASAGVAGLSRRVAARLQNLPEYRSARRILFYLAKKDEVQTEPLVRAALRQGLKVIVPITRWEEKRLVLSLLEDFDRDLAEGRFGILEPKPQYLRPWSESDVDLVIVPGVAFDREGRRLGFGGGFYDGLLKRLPRRVPRVALAFGFQVVEEVPAGEADVSMDIIVTENEVIKCRAGQSIS